ncbi:MAG: glycosyltransferase family 2 protein [Muribaculaceae bacterium]
MKVSVICPIYNEARYIRKCIDSILKQDYPKENLEVIFADGMSNDGTRDIVAEYAQKYFWIKLIDNPKRIVPTALNAAINVSKGDIIIRIDAHASYPSNYFSALVEAHKIYNADNIGAVCRTDVLNKTPKAIAIKEVLAHPLGVGNSAFRTGISKAKEVDTVPFGCWKRSTFDRFGMFDERLVRNQDIEFSKRIIRGGGHIVIIPETYSTYFARETFSKLAKNNFGNGKWNILTVWFTKEFDSLSLRHFVPLLFLCSLLIPILLGFIYAPFWLIGVISLTAYFIVISTISVKIALKRKANLFYLLASFFTLHISYGWGSLLGIIKLPFIR